MLRVLMTVPRRVGAIAAVASDAASSARELSLVADDQALVARVRAGDVAAFEALVRTYAQPLAAFAWRYVGSVDGAMDIAQDVFARVWQQRGALVVTGSVRAYLYAAARNRALNVVKRARVEARWRVAVAEGRAPAPAAPARADESLARAELAAAVRAAIDALPPRTREVVRLRWQEQLLPAEIARITGVSVSTVGNQLTRAARRLRAVLAGVWP